MRRQRRQGMLNWAQTQRWRGFPADGVSENMRRQCAVNAVMVNKCMHIVGTSNGKPITQWNEL